MNKRSVYHLGKALLKARLGLKLKKRDVVFQLRSRFELELTEHTLGNYEQSITYPPADVLLALAEILKLTAQQLGFSNNGHPAPAADKQKR